MSQQTAFPVSYQQKSLWFLNRLAPGSPAYNVNRAVSIHGSLEPERLLTVIRQTVSRNLLARIQFADWDGQPIGEVAEHAEPFIRELDGRGWGRRKLGAYLQDRTSEAFELHRGPLLRIELVRVEDEGWLLLAAAHQILLDEASLELLLEAFAEGYEKPGRAIARKEPAAEPEPEPEFIASVPYREFARRQTLLLDGARGEQLRRFWQEALQGKPTVLSLPTDAVRPPVQTFAGASHTISIGEEEEALLRGLAEAEHAKLPALLLAAYAALLHRYSGQERLTIGLLTSARDDTSASQIGTYDNPVPLAAELSDNPAFAELLGRTQSGYDAALAHRDYPFPLLVDLLEPVRDPSYPPLFQAAYAFRVVSPARDEPGTRQLRWEPFELEPRHARYDLTLAFKEERGKLTGRLIYNADLFAPSTIARLAGHYVQLLRSALEAPNSPVNELRVLDEEERRELLVDWNDTEKPYPEVCIHELFEQRAALHPDKEAVVFGHQSLTYRELNERANRLSRRLRQLGVGPDKLVGVYLHRNLDLPAVLFGILKAGGAYVPLDPNYPSERIAVTLADAGAHVIVTSSSLAEELPRTDAVIVRYDEEQSTYAGLSASNPEGGAGPRNLAYVIYTSGSTGRPKGVAIEHRSTTRWIFAAQELFEPERDFAGVLASTSICFDMSCFEFFVSLGSGGRAIIAENALHLPYLPAKNEVTLINTVPSAVAELIRLNGIPPSVRVCNFGGEPLFGALLRKLFEAHPSVVKAYNLYGPTEDTTFSTYEVLHPGVSGDPTIGRPIPNTTVYILDGRGEPVPAGVPGELYLGGAGLAREYLNRPDLTAERFVPHPFSAEPGARLYRTGDLVRYLPDKRIQYYGRLDNQVKVRGFRIELGEIESVLLSHPSVSEAAVLATGHQEQKRLVAYAEIKRGDTTARELRDYVKSKLPDYMVPGLIIPLEQFPLNPNGKLNRLALPEPDAASFIGERPREEARTLLEHTLLQVWRELFRNDSVGIHDNFFEIGGDSLLSAQISFVLGNHDLQVSPREIFRHQTIAELADALNRAETA